DSPDGGDLRKPDRESRPQAGSAGDVDGPAVLSDDPIADAEAEAGPVADGLGGEERVEDPVADGRVDPEPGGGDLDLDSIAVEPGTDGDGPAPVAGVDRVGEEVHDHLIDFCRVAGDRRELAEVED